MSESEPTRVTTGLDEMLGGGLPTGHVVLVTGLPGTGKTCFGLQFLFSVAAGALPDDYLSHEEEEPALLASARQFGWPVDAAVKAGTVKVMRLDPKQTHQNLARIQSDLAKELKALGAKRIVVDSVSLLNMLSDDEPARRNTLFGLAAACRESGATTVLTAEADPLHP